MKADQIPSRADGEYDEKVLSAGVGEFDCAFDSAGNDAEKKKAIEDELETCRQLANTWSDCDKAFQDCDKLLKAAQAEVSNSTPDWTLAHKKLLEVRQRLAKAWRSERSKRLVIGLSVWQVFAFACCACALMWLRLLPGWAPKVATTNPNVAFLISSFVIGAIGGIFDAAWSLSQNYAEQNFDPDQWLWHIVSPFLGGILGAAVFLMFLAGFVAATGTAITTENVTGTVESTSAGVIEFTAKTAVILALVFLAGFKQITVVAFFERIATAVFNKPDQSEKQSTGNS